MGRGLAGRPVIAFRDRNLGVGWINGGIKIRSFLGCLRETEKDDSSASKAGKIVIAQSPDAPTEVRLRNRCNLVRHIPFRVTKVEQWTQLKDEL